MRLGWSGQPLGRDPFSRTWPTLPAQWTRECNPFSANRSPETLRRPASRRSAERLGFFLARIVLYILRQFAIAPFIANRCPNFYFQRHHSRPRWERVILFVVDWRAGADLCRALFKRNPQNRSRLQFFFVLLPDSVPPQWE